MYPLVRPLHRELVIYIILFFLTGVGRPTIIKHVHFLGNYVKRNFNRWARQYEASKTDEIPAMTELMKWLPERMPTNERTTIVHGDFR